MATVAAMAGLAGGAHALWGYNRANFMYDRKMRMEQEFKVMEYRNAQAELWRDDVRDIIGLTERRMDSYLVVNTLQLGMCVGLFTEGRLEPGTPPWLLHLYMLTLGAAFMYLLMSVWLALHATVVAQCSSVRLLTQFVRLPIPRWEQLEAVRTYGSNFEELGAKHMLRVPFVGAKAGEREEKTKKIIGMSQGMPPNKADSADEGPVGAAGPALESGEPDLQGHVDPWQLEEHRSDIYELLRTPTAFRHHVQLARQAARYYQCYDAFARVSMSFGTNQLLHAITYYALGYCSVQDRAPWPAWCVGAIMCGIAIALIELDLSLTKLNRFAAQALIIIGPICASAAACAWTIRSSYAERLMGITLPIAYASHGTWLYFAMRMCRTQRQPNGSMLPIKFRPVLYLDIFGWLTKHEHKPGKASKDGSHGEYRPLSTREGADYWGPGDSAQDEPYSGNARDEEVERLAADPERRAEMQQELQSDIALWQDVRAQPGADEHTRSRIENLAQRAAELQEGDARGASGGSSIDQLRQSSDTRLGLIQEVPNEDAAEQNTKWLRLSDYSDIGTEIEYLYDAQTGDVRNLTPRTIAEIEAGTLNVVTPRFPTGREQVLGGGPARTPPLRTLTHTEAALDHLLAANEVAQRHESEENKTWAERGHQALAWMTEEADPLQDWNEEDTDSPGRTRAAAAAACLGFRYSGEPRTPRLMDPEGSGPQLGGGPDADLYYDYNATFPRVEGKEIMPGHERLQPGKIPWTVFRSATSLVVFLWFLGSLLPCGLFQGILQLDGVYAMPEPISTELGSEGPPSEDEAIAAEMEREHMGSVPPLPGGELINVVWPSHSGFEARALSCDPSGLQVVVSDDFGVYAAQVSNGASRKLLQAEARQIHASQLRGVSTVETQAPAIDVRRLDSNMVLNFYRVPPCPALEGQALKDISLVCGEGEGAACRVLVLHSHGRQLTECPLFLLGEHGAQAVARDPVHMAKEAITWKISTDWLHRKNERVDSMAVNNDCLEDTASQGLDTIKHFMPNKVGCVVVGTTGGRVVQMRKHMKNERNLVPERAVQQRSRAVRQGSLHVLSEGFVMALRPSHSILQALDVQRGTLIGEWLLPTGIRWRTICGGGNSLYILGHEKGVDSKAQLWRFPIPSGIMPPTAAALASGKGLEI